VIELQDYYPWPKTPPPPPDPVQMPKFKAGQIVFGHTESHFHSGYSFEITKVSPNHAGPGMHRYYGNLVDLKDGFSSSAGYYEWDLVSKEEKESLMAKHIKM